MSSSFEQNNPVNININDLVGCSEISNGYGYSESQPSTSNSMVKMERDSDSENDSCDTMDFDGMKDEPPEGFDMIEAKVEMEEGAALDTSSSENQWLTLKCQTCGFQATTLENLKVHLKLHVEKKVYNCDICTFQTRYRGSLNRHKDRHKDAHIKNEKINKNEIKEIKKETPKKITETQQCEHCEFKSDKPSILKKHQITHAGDENCHSCTLCDFKTKWKGNLTRHIATHSANVKKVIKMYGCPRCEFKSRCKDKLNEHIALHKTTEDIVYKCDQCNFQANHNVSFMYHMQLHDANLNVYKCEMCPFKSLYVASFRKHENLHKDQNENIFKCKECGYPTRWKINLRRHSLIHTY
ncbi:unnamed protein product [Brassicogethes aeneus]|uniref:C2H2-type domain-containing protein n=1 Tax=Brassicogethes aeneus TaxID=1431903 RepID=A0A9P0AY90_BRAAE|nr:unnamed protein product [Brassicogethes aeneus]